MLAAVLRAVHASHGYAVFTPGSAIIHSAFRHLLSWEHAKMAPDSRPPHTERCFDHCHHVILRNRRSASPRPARTRRPRGKSAAHESGSRARQARRAAIDPSDRYRAAIISRSGCENNRGGCAGHFPSHDSGKKKQEQPSCFFCMPCASTPALLGLVEIVFALVEIVFARRFQQARA